MTKNIARSDDAAKSVLPWLLDLPQEERTNVFVDVAAIGVQAALLGMHPERLMEKILQVLREWQATSEVYADPEAVKILTTPLEEYECSACGGDDPKTCPFCKARVGETKTGG